MTSPLIEERINALLAQMTLPEKVALLSGQDLWNTVPLPRLNIPSITMTDGPHGVRTSPEGHRPTGPTTCFPTGTALAATWNPALVERIGQALGAETHASGCDVLLGPCINIIRSPLGGRTFEGYSEDPYLAGRLAVAYIQGVQSQGVGTSLKHFACNSYEIERDRANSRIDERTLREIYLPAFEMAVKEAQPWTVMCAYNRINGVYGSQNDYLLNRILRQEWGFEGLVVSDWWAVHEIYAPVQSGLDLEMPGPAKYFGRLLLDALQRWQIEEATIDQAARRVLGLILKTGRMQNSVRPGSANTPAHRSLARQAATEAITLLKNEGALLPLTADKVNSIAVIGPNAAEAIIEGGGSSHVHTPYRVSPLSALQARLAQAEGEASSIRLEYEPGCDNFDSTATGYPIVPLSWLHMPDEGDSGQPSGPGLLVEGFRGTAQTNATGEAGQALFRMPNFYTEVWVCPDPAGSDHPAGTPHPAGTTHPAGRPEDDAIFVRQRGFLRPPESGSYRFQLDADAAAKVYLDDHLLLEVPAPGRASAEIALQAENHPLRIEYQKPGGQITIFFRLSAVRVYAPGEDERLERAVAAARRCDVAVVFAGEAENYEAEGSDRPHMRLPGGQDALIEAVAQANPRTVVVVNAGAPMAMPWAEHVAAILYLYLPGQENGNAIADVLTGAANPSGRLPFTLPKRLEDTPAYTNAAVPGGREVNYGEGIFVGYRWYEAKDIEPLFPFGHGLSYTTFEYGNLEVPASLTAGQPFTISVEVKNNGPVAGQETVQLYVADPQAALPRPPKELKGFTKLSLQPGETQTVTFLLDSRALSYYHPVSGCWVAEPGEFRILVGSSSKDIRLTRAFELEG